MIKNLLYSLFIHSLLLLAIYTSFNLKNEDEGKATEITVTLAPFPGSEKNPEAKAVEPQPEVEKKEETKEEKKPTPKKAPIKENKAPKPSPKNKINQELKKQEKPKEPQITKKPPIESKIQEFKKEDKIEEKEKPAEIKKDDIKNEGKEEKEDDKQKKEKDLGAKEEAPQKQEVVADKKSINAPTQEELASSLDNLDLSARERFNIQLQLRRCYKKAVDENQMKSDLKIAVKARINEGGYIDSNLDEIIDMKRYNDPSEPAYKITINNARRAIELCSPLRNLPLDKYYIWKEVLLEFDAQK